MQIAGHIFFTFLMFQLTFRLTVFETHIAQICIASTTCKIYRMHVLMMSSSCKSPISHCMLPFANLQLHAEHELKGGGVPSPEGLQLIRPALEAELCEPILIKGSKQNKAELPLDGLAHSTGPLLRAACPNPFFLHFPCILRYFAIFCFFRHIFC